MRVFNKKYNFQFSLLSNTYTNLYFLTFTSECVIWLTENYYKKNVSEDFILTEGIGSLSQLENNDKVLVLFVISIEKSDKWHGIKNGSCLSSRLTLL